MSVSPSTTLVDAFREVCATVPRPRETVKVSGGEPLQQLVVRDIPAALKAAVDDDAYLVKGSVGQSTWGETPWVAVLDRRVTASAQHGHYPVFLFRRDGSGVFLSLMQAITETRAARGINAAGVLAANAARMLAFIPAAERRGLQTGRMDLNGDSDRTKNYEIANIVAEFIPLSRIPATDAELLANLTRFLRLCDFVTTGSDLDNLDEEEGPVDPSSLHGEERRRYVWHRRAEGRNGALARRAKELQGYECCVCGRNYAKALGEMGKRAVDAHHLTPFHLLGPEPRDLDPLTDFAIVCSNCHRMLHSQNPPLLPADLVTIIDR